MSLGFVPSHTFVEDRLLLQPWERVKLGTRAIDDLSNPERMSLILGSGFYTSTSRLLLRSLLGARDGTRLMVAETDARELLGSWPVTTEEELKTLHTHQALLTLVLMNVGDNAAIEALLNNCSEHLRSYAAGLHHCFIEEVEILDWDRLRLP